MKTALVAEPAAIKPSEPFWVGIRLTMKPHWHTYWRNPGDSGSPTEVTWRLPAGFTAGEIAWPAPSVIRVGPAASFGYEGEVMLLTRITPPADLAPGSTVALDADVSYLVCEKECIPGEASVSLPLGVAASASDGPTTSEQFDEARRRLPQASPWTARFAAGAGNITLRLDAADLRADAIRSAMFFPHDNSLIVNAEPQKLDVGQDGLRLAITRSQIASTMPQRLDGVLVIDESLGADKSASARHAFAVSAAMETAPAAGGGVTLAQAVLLALAAGLILNLMPCVLPVLSIKVLHLTQHAGETPARVRMHGIVYTLGVLSSFAVLAGVLYAARAGGAEVGWGFQLQSPVTIAALAFALFAFGLSLSGLLPIGTSLTRVGGASLMHRPGLTGSFFAGTLATIVATPCTAPFMGASVGFALTQPFVIGLAVFLALGLGLALPFLMLSFAPRLQRLLPRPGAWMETLKQLLAFPLYATVAWLVWVLSFQVGPTGLMAALGGLVLIGFGAWAFNHSYGRRDAPGRAFQVAASAAAAGAVALAVMIGSDQAGKARAGAPAAAAEGNSEAFTQARLDALAAEQRPVFVNMTAAWCITCLVNERTALSTQAVKAALERKGVTYLKGDWTNRNPEITRLLERFGRGGVPLYVLYPRKGEPVVLPQILTEAMVLQSMERL